MPKMGNPVGGAKYKKPEHYAMEEIASRIAAATRSNNEAVAVPGLEESGVEEVGPGKVGVVINGPVYNAELPPSEWSPTEGKPVETIGQPKAANSEGCGDGHCNRDNWITLRELMESKSPPANDNYTTIRTILNAAFNHAATGKGKERHARNLPFDKQPMLETTRLVGHGFPLGQAIKKAGEAAGMIERGELDAAEAECLGAINYLAGAVAWMREVKEAA